jgi:predicted phage terminase large subunit-like protein
LNKELIKASLRESTSREGEGLYNFVKIFWSVAVSDPMTDNFHIKYICEQLDMWARSIIRNEVKKNDFIVNISPGETKSLICSVMFPAWLWTLNPSLRIIAASYNEKLSIDLAVKSKDIIGSNKYQELYGNKVKMRQDMDSKQVFQNTKGGWRLSTSVGAMVTGFHAHVKILDDPNNPFDTYNMDLYEKNSLWYDTVFFNRNVDDSKTLELLVQQRVGINDMTAHWLSKNKKPVVHVVLPATIEYEIKPKELIKFYKDGVMNPVRKGYAKLADIQDQVGEVVFDSQYGQNPSKKKTGLVNKSDFEIIDAIPDGFWYEDVYLVVDGNFGKKDNPDTDPMGIMVCCVYGFDLYIIDFIRVREKYTRQKEILREVMGKYVGSYANSNMIVEMAAFGGAIVEDLKAEMPINIIEVEKSNDSKLVRFNGVTKFIKGGRVKLLYDKLVNHEWNDKYLDVVTKFPNVKHDEEVDTTIMALNELIKNNDFADDYERKILNL